MCTAQRALVERGKGLTRYTGGEGGKVWWEKVYSYFGYLGTTIPARSKSRASP